MKIYIEPENTSSGRRENLNECLDCNSRGVGSLCKHPAFGDGSSTNVGRFVLYQKPKAVLFGFDAVFGARAGSPPFGGSMAATPRTQYLSML